MDLEVFWFIFSLIGTIALLMTPFLIILQLMKINKNIKGMAEEVKWVINRLKNIEEPKAIPIKRKPGRPPKQK
jgi:hypothetical protein